MKSRTKQPCPLNSFRWIISVCILFALGVTAVRAGLTLEMNVIRYDQYGYYFSPNLMTNSTPPVVPFGDYNVTSLDAPTNGSSASYHFDTNGFNGTGGISWGYGDFDTMVHELTNGNWSIFVTNSVTTNVYHFTVTANMSSNSLPLVTITYPANGALNVTNQPTYMWQGPTNYSDLVIYAFDNSSDLPVTQTSWFSPQVLYQGMNSVTVHYDSNSMTAAVSSVPMDNASHPISSWVSTAHLQDYISSQFTVGTVDTSGTGHSLVAHYAWDTTNLDGTASGVDSSGNGYNLDFNGSFGAQGGLDWTTDAAAGPGAIQFFDSDSGSGGYAGWSNTPPNVLATLAGSFSISCWVRTTQNNFGWDTAPAYYGAGIVSADVGGLANDVIPIALTGDTIGFNTGGDVEDVTLNSVTAVNDGNYHHVVVTRNQQTGQKIIYIDGVLDSFSSGTTNLLDDPQKLSIGALANAGNSDPNDGSYYQGYDGELDDLQIYSGVLSAFEVAQLFANPGTTANQIITAPLIGRYNFEDTNSPGTDSSGNSNDSNCGSGNGGTNLDTFSTDAAVGSYARDFEGDTALCFYPNGAACFNNLSNAFYGSFSWTAWVKTTNSVNFDFANAYFGNPIWFEYSDPTNQAEFSITGSKAAFTVGNPNGGSDTQLHSTTTVNDGAYHFIAATRNADSGLTSLYVDGNLEATGVSTNGPRIASSIIYLAGGYYGFFDGLLDDVRFYGGELSASDVAILAGKSVTDFNPALNTTGLSWATGGDTSWFVETTNAWDGVSAAQSGSVTNNQTSSLSVTLTGPGTLTFYWASQDDCNNFYYEFDIDGSYQNEIYCSQSWIQDGPYTIPAGPHTLSWTVYADGDTDPTEAGFLDQVSYVPSSPNTGPIITLNPFNQTNYPGYNVALLAAATSNPAATWQWFKVGSASPIPNATSTLFIPTNSGTAGVAGSYYAVASNLVGTANTTTAAVTFAVAPLPPDWSFAAKSPFQSVDASTFTKDYYLGCAVDPAGDLYAAAQYYGNMDVLTNGNVENVLTAPGNYAAALVKHAANGTPQWAVGLTNNNSTGSSYGTAVAAAPGNGAYLAANISGTNWLGTNKFVDLGGSSILLSRFDAGGSNIWSKLIGGTNVVYTSYDMLTADPSGNVTLAGIMSGTVNFGGTNLSSPSQVGFLIQYDANGVVRWAQTTPDIAFGLTYGNGLLFATLISTVSSSVTNVSIGSLSNLTDRAWMVACLNPATGQPIWLRGAGDQYGANNTPLYIIDRPMVSISGSDVFMTGNGFGSAVAFGGLSVSLPGGRGQYFARYDTNGNSQVATVFGSASTMLWDSAANASGVYVTGDFDDYSQFGSLIIAAPVNATNDLGTLYFTQPLIAKLDRNGNPVWARNGVSSAFANFRGIGLASDGVWAAGFLEIANSVLAQFGAYSVYSDYQDVGFPLGTITYHQGGLLAKVTDRVAAAQPVTLMNVHSGGGNFQFSFLSQSGFNHSILYRTNLAVGTWQTNSSVGGDGTVKTISLPFTLFTPAKQGFIRVSTQ